MNIVEPIRDVAKVREIEEYLRDRCKRDWMLFIAGINSGLRISDLLNLRVRDVQGIELYITEKKTGKKIPRRINPDLSRAFRGYTVNLKDSDFLFTSREGDNRPITRARAYQILSQAARKHGLKRIGTHTLRKTFGYHFYQQTKDLALLRAIYGHSSEKETRRYIGLDQDMMDNAMQRFSI